MYGNYSEAGSWYSIFTVKSSSSSKVSKYVVFGVLCWQG